MRPTLALGLLLVAQSAAAQAPLPSPQPLEIQEPFDDGVVQVKDQAPVPEAPPAPKKKEQTAPRLDVAMLAGGELSVGTDAETGISPFLRVNVEAKTGAAYLAPTFMLQGDLGGLPGDSTPQLARLETFRALQFRLGFVQRFSPRVWVDFYFDAGFSTRLAGQVEPLDKTARFWSAGAYFGRSKRGWLKLGIGTDQRLDAAWRTVVTTTGALKLATRSPDAAGVMARLSLTMAVEAILGLGGYLGDPGRDSVRIAIAAGI